MKFSERLTWAWRTWKHWLQYNAPGGYRWRVATTLAQCLRATRLLLLDRQASPDNRYDWRLDFEVAWYELYRYRTEFGTSVVYQVLVLEEDGYFVYESSTL